jgi:hypothetical protein
VVTGRVRQRVIPEPPNLPDKLSSAGNDFSRVSEWDGLIGDTAEVLSDVVYDLAMTECIWRGVEASSRTFSNLRCRDVVFEQCHFAGGILGNAALTRLAFIECRLTGIVFSGAQLHDVEGLSLHGSVVDSLRGAYSLTGGRVGVDATQLVPLGAAVLAEMGVQVTDRPQIGIRGDPRIERWREPR